MNGGYTPRWRLEPDAKPTCFPWRRTRMPSPGLLLSDSKWVFTGGHDGRVKQWPIDGDGKNNRRGGKKGRSSKVVVLEYWSGRTERAYLFSATTSTRLLDP